MWIGDLKNNITKKWGALAYPSKKREIWHMLRDCVKLTLIILQISHVWKPADVLGVMENTGLCPNDRKRRFGSRPDVFRVDKMGTGLYSIDWMQYMQIRHSHSCSLYLFVDSSVSNNLIWWIALLCLLTSILSHRYTSSSVIPNIDLVHYIKI